MKGLNIVTRIAEYIVCMVIGVLLHILWLQHNKITKRQEFVVHYSSSPILVVKNGCYIAATGYKDSYEAYMQLKGHKHEARIMYVDYVYSVGHAVCVFNYEGNWHCYDSRIGTRNLGKFDTMPDPDIVASMMDCGYVNAHWYP